MWEGLTIKAGQLPDAQVRDDWLALNKAWAAFSQSFAVSIGNAAGVVTAPDPAPPTPAPDAAALTGREEQLIAAIAAVDRMMTAKVTGLQQAMMRGQFVAPQMSEVYRSALATFDALEIEAGRLGEAGLKRGAETLKAFTDDTKKALSIATQMIGQNQQFEIGKAAIWTDAIKSITATQLDINRSTSEAFTRANQKVGDALKS